MATRSCERGTLPAKEAATGAVLVALNCGAWIWAWVAFGHRPPLFATAALAYSLGLRHAFDADHIAAIDNVVRRFLQHGRAAHTVGLFFSFGHSTIVFAGCIALSAAANTLLSRLDGLRDLGGTVGTVVSATFLLTIGLANLCVLKGVWAALSRARRGASPIDEDSDVPVGARGLLTRILQPLLKLVDGPWHMFLIGLLFGLGFDTTTEVGLLSISAGARDLSVRSILVFPALFAAGMSLMDTLDSMLMSRAYGWALIQPVRKLWYNLTVTSISAAVALFIGGVEALGLFASKLNFMGLFWSLITVLNRDLARVGYAVVAILVAIWAVSVLRHNLPRYLELR